jgi:hypothetical protein
VAAISLNVLVSNSQEPEYRQATREEKLAAALELMAKDFNAALVTVDSEGQPRARTVEPFSPEDDWTIWVATNPLDVFWPNYPAGYLLISVKPIWLEIMTPEIPIDAETWQPQAVRFDD